jgi:hypothetical protein
MISRDPLLIDFSRLDYYQMNELISSSNIQIKNIYVVGVFS